MSSTVVDDVRLYRVSEVVKLLGQSRSAIYELIRAGRLRSVKEGRTRLISSTAIRDYIALLEREMELRHEQA